jgi:very-short-patch-repair endonuclease
VHRSSTLESDDTTRKRAIPVTRPARTIIDCAEGCDRRGLERLIDAGQRLGLCAERELHRAAERHVGRVGASRVRRLLGKHQAGSTATANDFEELFLAICDAHCIPRPQVNRRLGSITPDFRWPEQRVIVETDGWATHGRQRRVFESDRERDVNLTVEGWRVLRFTWRQLTERPAWVAAQVLAVLRSAGSSSGQPKS